MNLYNLDTIREYSMNHAWATEGIAVPHIIIVISFLVVIMIVNSYYEERIMRKHLLYGRYRKESVAQIIGIEECVLLAGGGQQFYSIIIFDVQGKCIETKITAGKNDCIGRRIDIMYWGNGKNIVIRKQEEERFPEKHFDISVNDHLKSDVIGGILGSLLLAWALGINYLPLALIMLTIILCVFYIIYPCVFYVRMLMWKTNLTWK